MGITELAEIIRRGCDEDHREVEIDRLKLCPTCHKPIGEQSKMLAGVKYECGHYFEWDRLFDLRDREAQTQTRALAHVRSRRRLLDEALGWEHNEVDDPWFSCKASPSYKRSYDGNGPCTCGRDVRVLAVLTHLAAAYQETT